MTAQAGIELGESTRDQIFQVADYFTDIEKDVSAYRAIGLVFSANQLHEDAIEYCKRSLEMSDDNDSTRFLTHWLMADSHLAIGQMLAEAEEGSDDEDDDDVEASGANGEEVTPAQEEKGNEEDASDNAPTDDADDATKAEQRANGSSAQFEEAIRHLADALAVMPSGWEKDASQQQCVEGIYVARAKCESALERPDDAIRSYQQSLAVRPDVASMNGWDVRAMLTMRDWTEDPQEPKRFIDLLRGLIPKQRHLLYDYMFANDVQDDLDFFNHCAKLAGPESITFYFSVLEDYIQSKRRGSAHRIIPMETLASAYQDVLGDKKRAIEINTEILNYEIKYDEVECLDEFLAYVRLQLADLFFSEFRAATNPKDKMTLLQKMKSLPNMRPTVVQGNPTAMGNPGEWSDSQTGIMLAIMTRTMGSPMEYQEILEKSFKTCIEGLSDSVGWNDSDSFRLLSKVLSCVPGLEHDAQIALSCQFSITDPNVDHAADADAEKESKGADRDSGTNGVQNTSKSEDDVTTGAEDDNDGSDDEEEDTEDEIGQVEETTIRVAKVTITSDSDTQAPLKTNADTETNGDTSDAEKGGEGDESDDEDLLPSGDWELGCDGDCETMASRWDQPWYFCIFCANCDLCKDCYQVCISTSTSGCCTMY